MALQGRGEGVENQGAFPRATHPGDAAEGAQRDFQVDPLEVMGGRTAQNEPADRLGTAGRKGNPAATGKKRACQGVFLGGDFLRGALGNQFPAVGPGAGTKFDQVIRTAERLLVVFHHQKRVAEIAEVAEEIEEPGVVDGVKTDAGLVEDVKDAGKSSAELGGQAGTAGLASREGVHGAIEGEVTEPEFFEKSEAMENRLAEGVKGVGGGTGGFGELFQKLPRRRNGELAKGGDAVAFSGRSTQRDKECIGVEALAAAAGTGAGAEKTPDAVAGGFRNGRSHAAVELRENPLKRFLFADEASLACVLKRNGLAVGAAEKKIPCGGRPLGPGDGRIDAEMTGEIAGESTVVGADAGMGAVPGGDGPLVQGQFRAGDNLGGVGSEPDAEAGAVRTGALGAVEGEMARGEVGCPVTRLVVHGFGRKGKIRDSGSLGKIRGGEGEQNASLAQAQGQIQGVCQAGAAGLLQLQPVDDQFQGLLPVCGGDVDPLALLSGAEKALLFPSDRIGGGEGGQQDGEGAGVVAEQAVDDLLRRRGQQGPSGFGIVGRAVGREENAKVIVDFRGGGQGGAAGAAGVTLLDGKGGGKALDGVDGGGRQAFQMKPGVGRKTFEVAALSLGVDGVEGEGGFSGSGGAGEDDEAVLGDVEIESGEIMLAGAADAEEIAGSAHGKRGHSRALPGLGGRGGRGIDVDAPVAAIKADVSVGKGEKRVIPAHADVGAGVEFGAALADEDGTGEHELATEALYAKPLAVAVPTVACGSLTFFMCHGGLPG